MLEAFAWLISLFILIFEYILVYTFTIMYIYFITVCLLAIPSLFLNNKWSDVYDKHKRHKFYD